MRHFPVEEATIELDDEARAIRDRVHAFPDLRTFFKAVLPQTFPEKFLVLAAWNGATADGDTTNASFKRRHLVRALVSLGETPPANPPRDIHQAIDQGWFLQVQPGRRLLKMTNSGWKRLGEMLDSGDGETVLV